MIQPRWGRIFVGRMTRGSAFPRKVAPRLRRGTCDCSIPRRSRGLRFPGLSDEIPSGFPAATVAKRARWNATSGRVSVSQRKTRERSKRPRLARDGSRCLGGGGRVVEGDRKEIAPGGRDPPHSRFAFRVPRFPSSRFLPPFASFRVFSGPLHAPRSPRLCGNWPATPLFNLMVSKRWLVTCAASSGGHGFSQGVEVWSWGIGNARARRYLRTLHASAVKFTRRRLPVPFLFRPPSRSCETRAACRVCSRPRTSAGCAPD